MCIRDSRPLPFLPPPYLTLPPSFPCSLVLRALEVLCMLQVLQQLGDAYFYLVHIGWGHANVLCSYIASWCVVVWKTVSICSLAGVFLAFLSVINECRLLILCCQNNDTVVSETHVITLNRVSILLFMAVLRADIIFLPCDFYLLLLFFHRLISAVADWMSTILQHMMWP